MGSPTESQLATLDDDIESLEQSLKKAKDLRKVIRRKQKPKRNPAPPQAESHSSCNDEEMAFYAALAGISADTERLANSTTLGQTVYNAWQDCLGS